MSDLNKTNNHIKFNRHKIFNAEDRVLVLALTGVDDSELEHKLFGLFDGYLYKDLLVLAKNKLNKIEFDNLTKLVSKIKNN